MLPTQLQAIMNEHSKFILDKFALINKHTSSPSSANSIDGDSNMTPLQIPTIRAHHDDTDAAVASPNSAAQVAGTKSNKHG